MRTFSNLQIKLLLDGKGADNLRRTGQTTGISADQATALDSFTRWISAPTAASFCSIFS
jgi:hypothetical protein